MLNEPNINASSLEHLDPNWNRNLIGVYQKVISEPSGTSMYIGSGTALCPKDKPRRIGIAQRIQTYVALKQRSKTEDLSRLKLVQGSAHIQALIKKENRMKLYAHAIFPPTVDPKFAVFLGYVMIVCFGTFDRTLKPTINYPPLTLTLLRDIDVALAEAGCPINLPWQGKVCLNHALPINQGTERRPLGGAKLLFRGRWHPKVWIGHAVLRDIATTSGYGTGWKRDADAGTSVSRNASERCHKVALRRIPGMWSEAEDTKK